MAGTWKVMVGVTKDGCPLIGAESVRAAEHNGELVERYKLFGSQLAHWCSARVNGEWSLMTWTEAKRNNADMTYGFPGRQ